MSCLDKLNEFYKKKANINEMIYQAIGRMKNRRKLDWSELESELEDMISKSTYLTYKKCLESMIGDFRAYIWTVLIGEILNYNRGKSNDSDSLDQIDEKELDKPASSFDRLDIEAIKLFIKGHFKDDDTFKIFQLAFLDALPPRAIEEMTGLPNQTIRNRIFAIRKLLRVHGRRFLL